MFLRKVPPGQAVPHDDELLAALLEPLPGHSDSEVIQWLTAQGDANAALLSPGFISAKARRSTLNAAKAIAHVHLKPLCQPR